MRFGRFLLFFVGLSLSSVRMSPGVIFLQTDDPLHNTTTPGDNSGWQYEGQFGDFLGTPIAPHYFITAHHIEGYVGEGFVFHGAVYTTTAVFPDPGSDLQIWQVRETFSDYAPLYQSGAEIGSELRVYGRGTQRGDAISLGGRQRGWAWGAADNVERWGRNLVSTTWVDSDSGWPFLLAAFDSPGLPDEAHLSVGDSAGGVFLLEDGLWKLAGINYAVDDLATQADGSDAFTAAIFDARGFYSKNAQGNWTLIPDAGTNVPTSFYSSRIFSRLNWIKSVIGQEPSTLATETYRNWLTLYFAPGEIADPSVTGPAADPDGDGIPNLSEYAFNLDPTFPQPTVMVAGTGLGGLPLVQPVDVGSGGTRLTVEFVRRKNAARLGLSYAVQWTSSLAPASDDWEPGGTESVTPINPRWERVKVTDTVALGSAAPTRFARVAVSRTPAP